MSYSFADLAIAERIKGLNPVLELIDEVIDWAPIDQLLERHCAKGKQSNGRRDCCSSNC